MFRSCFLLWSKQWPSLPIIITEDSFFLSSVSDVYRFLLKTDGVRKEGKKEGGKEERGEVKERGEEEIKEKRRKKREELGS